MNESESIILVMLVSLKPDHQAQFANFAMQNAPLLNQYQIQPIKSIAIKSQGQILGKNMFPQPDFISLFKISSMQQFMAYMADECYATISELRAQATHSVTGFFTYARQLPEPLFTESPTNERLYMLGLASFIKNDDAGLDKFNRAAVNSGLFKRNGMHVEYQLEPFKAVQVVGDFAVTKPDRIQVFFLDRAEDLKSYLADPDYQALSPLRDSTLTQYDFFAGQLK